MLKVICVTFSTGTNGSSPCTGRRSSLGDCIIDHIVRYHWIGHPNYCHCSNLRD